MNLPEIAFEISNQLIQVDGVIAVVVGGSWAKGTAKPDSDIDLALYYNPKNSPSLEHLRSVANHFDDSPSDDILTDFSGWGPWINGGGWLNVKGQRIDILYSNVEQVRFFIQEVLEGRSVLNHQPGHPHGFHSHMFAAQVHHAKILHDPRDEIGRLKTLLSPYPAKLKEGLIKEFLWQAEFALLVAEKGVTRADIFYVTGFLFDCAASLVQVLFALNETFWLNEKGSIATVDSFPIKPPNFKSRIEAVLAHIGTNTKELNDSYNHFKDLVAETQALTKGIL